MIRETKSAVTDLLKREPAKIVVGTGIFFGALAQRHDSAAVEDVLESHRSGVWGDESVEGVGFPVLRSTNMRGSKADVRDAAWRQIPEKQAAACALRSGDILVTKSSGSSDLVGKAVLFEQPRDGQTYLFSNFTHRLRPDAKRIAPKFLAWFLRSPQSLSWRYEAQQNAVGLRNLQTSEFLAQRVPLPPLGIQQAVADYFDGLESGNADNVKLPAELSEQRRIVTRIDALAAQIAEARSVRHQAADEAERFLASYVSQLFREGPEIGWKMGALGDLVTDSCYGTSEKTTDDSSGVPILRMGNVQNGRLELRDLKYLHLSQKERAKLALARGDILVNRTNSAELVGKCAVFEVEGEFAFASYLIRLRLDPTQADPHLVAAYINSPLGRDYMFREKKQMTGQANVNAAKLKALPIALPPLPEQRRIMAYLDGLQAQVDALKRLQSEVGAELDALLPSVLDRAFKGEL